MSLLSQLNQLVVLPVYRFIKKILNGVWQLFKRIFLNKYVRCGVAILQTVWPLLLVLIINYLFLNLMDQSQDLLDSLMHNFVYSTCAFICLLIYSLTVWYTTRIVFLLKDQSELIDNYPETSVASARRPALFLPRRRVLHYRHVSAGLRWAARRMRLSVLVTNPAGPSAIAGTDAIYDPIDSETLRQFTKWTPISVGVIPFLALGSAFSTVNPTTWHWLSLGLMILLYIWIAYQVRNYVGGPQDDEQVITRYHYEDLRQPHKRTLLGGLVGGIILIILATCWQTNLFLSSTLGPLAVVFLALTLWAMLAGWFTYIDYRYRAPFTLVCFLLMILFNNNNHQIRTIDTDSKIGTYSAYSQTRQTVPKHFGVWLESLRKYRTSQGYSPTDIIPIYLIATEGGGIRSAYWTAAVLRQLDSANRDFFRHVYAISGVSGGSVGATFYTARYRDCLRNPQLQIDMDAFFEHDHLSPLLTAMLIPDMLQKFSPVGINSLDRAQYLEDSWSDMYQSADVQRWPVKSEKPLNSFEQPFLGLWDNDKGKYRYDIPVLFLNATQAETGRKGILTPLSIKADSNFLNVIDIQDMVYRHIPLKTAASISARFPLVTPPATIRVVNDPSRDAANFVDGGYIDNSGTTTLLSVLSSLTKDSTALSVLRKRLNVNFRFKLLILKNSSDINPDQAVKPIGGLYEVAAPLKAFFESWDNGGGYRRYAVQEYLRGFSAFTTGPPDAGKAKNLLIDQQMYAFDLDRKTPRIPLGWELSEQAEANIREQACLQKSVINEKYKELFTGLILKPKPARNQLSRERTP